MSADISIFFETIVSGMEEKAMATTKKSTNNLPQYLFDNTQQHNQVKKSVSSFLLFCAPNTPINEKSEARTAVAGRGEDRNMVGEHKKIPNICRELNI